MLNDKTELFNQLYKMMYLEGCDDETELFIAKTLLDLIDSGAKVDTDKQNFVVESCDEIISYCN